jgi:hypothetical protein
MTLATTALKCAKMLGRVNAAGTAITDLETEIKEEIADTIRHYNRKPYALTEFRGAVITTAASTTWYSTVDLTGGDGDQDKTGRSAVDVNDVLSLTYMRDDSNEWPMSFLPYRDFEPLFEGSTPEGGPTKYTIYAGQVGLWPTPDAAYSIYFSAKIKAPVPANDSDTSVWLTQCEEMIAAGACKRVCLKYLRDHERASTFAIMENDAKNDLELETVLKSSSRKLKVYD